MVSGNEQDHEEGEEEDATTAIVSHNDATQAFGTGLCDIEQNPSATPAENFDRWSH